MRAVIAIAAALLFAMGETAFCQAQLQPAKDQAKALVSVGQSELSLARVSEAQASCDAALKLDPENGEAKTCLQQAAGRLIDQDLDSADAKLLARDKSGATALASKWTGRAAGQLQQARAKDILKRAGSIGVFDALRLLFPDWLLQFLLTVITLAVLGLLLLLARLLWREWKRGEWYGNLTNTTRWNMHPLQEEAASKEQTGLATDLVLDALARAGHELRLPIWEPRLLLLRPTPPAKYEPAIISEFLSEAMEPIRMSPPADDLCLEWKLHDVRLNDAIQNLQLKTSMGIDIGSVVRFLMSMVQWFNAGEPIISGAAAVGEKSIAIHLAAHGGRVESAAVAASTDIATGIDAMELSAERVAFKFLFRMHYPEMTNDQIDGFSALRQGATLFAQYAGTAPGMGEGAKARTSSLERAAFNFSFFRASIPTHCDPGCGRHGCSSLQITDGSRQAVLLAEGVAHALVGSEEERMRAIDCFRQLQDWPGSSETEALRRQAAYNEAIVWEQTGNVARSVLMLTEVLGEKAPDTVVPGGDAPALPLREKKGTLPNSISLPARAARVSAFARYDRDSWSLVPESRVDLIAGDADKLVQDLDSVCSRSDISARDHRLVRHMYVETLRAAGHIELMRVIHTNASRLYENARPIGLRSGNLDNNSCARLRRGISYMRACEELSPSSELYCDLAESYLLLKQFTVAEGYARHAILESDPPSERAYYLAVESLWLQNTPPSMKMAREYLSDFNGPATLEELKSLEAEMATTDEAHAASAPPSSPYGPKTGSR
jgi:hypothetical protein